MSIFSPLPGRSVPKNTFKYKKYNYKYVEPYKLNCECDNDTIILNTFMPRVNLNYNNDQTMKYFVNKSTKDQCILELTLSCKNIEYEFSSKDEIIGIIAKK